MLNVTYQQNYDTFNNILEKEFLIKMYKVNMNNI